MHMGDVIPLAIADAFVGCKSVPSHPDPLAYTGEAACPVAFESEKDEVAWRKNVVTSGRIGGVLLAASGPAVMLGGIALDDQPATPPVEAFVIGAGLSASGVLAVVLSGVLVDDLEQHRGRAPRLRQPVRPGHRAFLTSPALRAAGSSDESARDVGVRHGARSSSQGSRS